MFADWIPVLALADDDALHVAYVPRSAPGLTVVDDWNGMGQRTTASGTVKLVDVAVPAEHVVPHDLTFTGPQLHGAVAELLHTAIDVGIAGAALADAVHFVRTKSRPWFESGYDTAAEDPLLIQRFGELAIRVRAAEALLGGGRDGGGPGAGGPDRRQCRCGVHRGGRRQGVRGRRGGGAGQRAVRGLRHAVQCWTPSNLHRHWRNARTHTLHDPARWKVQHIGRYVLNGTRPPRHELL